MKITRGNTQRLYVNRPVDWATGLGTDYMAGFGVLASNNDNLLTNSGWTNATGAVTAGAAADFLSSSDKAAPRHILLADAGDDLFSPPIFGDYGHGEAAANVLGYSPTAMVMEVYAAFTTASNDESVTGFGLVEDGGDPETANDHLAFIRSDGTNFICRSGADADTGAAVDTAWHLWKIRITQGTTDKVEWFIDGTSQGTLDLTADEFPVYWAAHVLDATGANDVAIAWVHIYYE